jgi:lipopolysaccharide/colanic/teichoic acid biosynthesis glycosyltransferase
MSIPEMATKNIHSYYFSKTKRFFDLSLSLVLLIVFLPLLMVIWLLIAITDGLPVVFKQKRTGKNGETFIMYKFRTMKKNADLLKHKYVHLNEAPEPMFKIHNDPRFIKIGKFLSRSGLDELPQLINILKNEMSFVGPRPLPIKEAKALPKNWKSFRQEVKPGIFSDWAISWERHKSFKKWQQLEKSTLSKGSLLRDFYYIYEVVSSQLVLFFKKKTKTRK